MLRFHIVLIQNNFAYIDLTLFSDVWGVSRKDIGLIFMLFFTYFQILVTFILNIRIRCGGSKLKKLEKCDFYAILTRNINAKQLKKTIGSCYTEFKKFFKQH